MRRLLFVCSFQMICDFISEHCGGSDWAGDAPQQAPSFGKKIAGAVEGMPLRHVLGLLGLLAREATDVATGGSQEWRGVLRLSDISPWLAG